MVLYDMNQSIQSGGVFEKISNIDTFTDKCTVMNGPLPGIFPEFLTPPHVLI